MEIDANGKIHVDAEEPRSGAKASFTLEPNQQSKTITQIIHTNIQFRLHFFRTEQRLY